MKKWLVALVVLGIGLGLITSITVSGTGGDSFSSRFRVGGDHAGLRYVGGSATSQLFVGYGFPLLPPTSFVATAYTSNEIQLSWFNPNLGTLLTWPNLETIIRMEDGEYPDDPPSGADNSTEVYRAPTMPWGAHAYTVMGLSPGKTYYFRIWFYDPVEGYTAYDQDFATTYAGEDQDGESGTPPNWFTEPTCDLWENVPMIMTIVNGINDKYGFPTNYLCMVINLFLLSCAMTTSYGGAVAVRGQPTGTGTILVPFIVMCAGFLIGPVIGAFPGFFLAIGVIIGIGVAFAWSRA